MKKRTTIKNRVTARNTYDAYSQHYNLFEGRLSHATWKKGIIAEIKASGRTSGRVFDAGAGTGIGAKCLKAVGSFHVTSCDRNPSMLVQARPVSDAIMHADIAHLPRLGVTFDFIVSGADALNYLCHQDLARFLRWSRPHLATKGRVIFDYSSPRFLRHTWASKRWNSRAGAFTMRWRTHFEKALQRTEISLTCFCHKKALWEELHYQYALDTFDIYAIARSAGLAIQRIRNLSGPTFSPDSPKHLYVLAHRAQK